MGNALFDLLAALIEGGSIRHAAQRLGCSYRYMWDSIRKWERVLGEPLVAWSQGRKARLTEFAEKLVWAERRARTRMQPHIEALRSDLDRVLAEARDDRHHLLTIRASHDIALPLLLQHAAKAAHLYLHIDFQGSVDALRALNDRQCLIAGFHVPASFGAKSIFSRAITPLLNPRSHRLIACSRRMQGLMVRKEHASAITSFPDLVERGLRFVNRQPGSGTRMLVDHLLHEQGLSGHRLIGAGEHIENSHVSVALCIASGVADAGIGIETAALQFGLHFIPVIEENYFLACLTSTSEHPAIAHLRHVLAGEGWQAILAGLPGYRSADDPGALLTINQGLPCRRPVHRRKS